MKKIFLFIIIVLSYSNFLAQKKLEQFTKIQKEKDSSRSIKFLNEWSRSGIDSEDYYATAASYYFNLCTEVASETEKTIANSESDKKAKALEAMQHYLQTSYNLVTAGAELFPNRLDLRFGKTFILQQLSEFEQFEIEIASIIDQSLTNKNNWLWTNNIPKENGEKELLTTIHTYLRELYETENDSLLLSITKIGDKTIKHYPNCIPILSITGVAYLLLEKYDLALKHLLHAEKQDNEDYIVKNNIAMTYYKIGNKEKAIQYFEILLEKGDDQAKKAAKNYLMKLKK